MSLKLLKLLLAGTGTALMLLLTLLAQSATASSNHTINVDNLNGHSLSIVESDGSNPVYTLDGKTYHWENLSDNQKTALLKIRKDMSKITARFTDVEKAMRPYIEDIELEADKISALVRAIELPKPPEPPHSLPELEARAEMVERAEQVELTMQKHEATMAKHEQLMHLKQLKLENFEHNIEQEAKVFEQDFNQQLMKIIEILN